MDINQNLNNINNKINNRLLYEYNEKFNKLYENIIFLDQFIMNKEELINKENNEVLLKEHTIIILTSLLYIYIVFVGYYILYYIKLFTFEIFLFLLIITIIYILFSAYSQYIDVNSKLLFDQNIKYAAVEMQNYVKNVVNDLYPRKCPSQCDTINVEEEEDNSNNINNKRIIPYNHPTTNIQPQINVWKNGDVPIDLFTKPGFQNNLYKNPSKLPDYSGDDNSPKSNFSAPINSGATYYQCKWEGGDDNYDLPNQEIEKYSTIPCSSRSNYRTVGKYFCPKNINPNYIGTIGCVDVEKDFN
jgi:hypothetical protein